MHRKWWTLIAVSVATFMLLLDITVVNTALPAIQEDLGASFTELQWVIDAYTLSLAALVLTAGVLADRLGRRRVFAFGLGVFTVASLFAGLATDPTFLNIARAIQGIGGAVMFAVSLALIAQEFTAGRERGTAMGVYGATIGVAVATGPLVGGALTDSLGWESIFFINVPIGIAAIAVTYGKLRETRDPNASSIDWGGLVTFSTALFLLVLALLRGNEEGWGSTGIVALLAGAGVLLAAFIAIESRVRQPMLPLHLFRNRTFTGVQLAAAGVSASMFALFLYLTFYLQGFLGHDAARGRAALPAADRHDVLRLGGRGCADHQGPRPGAPLGRPRPGGRGAGADGRPQRDGRVDGAARRLPAGGRGRGPDQPGHRRRRRVGRAEGAERHGRRASTTRSARSGSPSASRPGGRSSSDVAPPRSRSWRPGLPRPPASGRGSWSRRSPRGTSTRRWRASPRDPARAWPTRLGRASSPG